MSDSFTKTKHSKMLIRRFQMVVGVTIVMLSLSLISTFFFEKSSYTVILLVIDIFLMASLFPLIKFDQADIAKQIYIWSNVILLSFIFWNTGGLLSSAIVLVYPIFLIVSALLGGARTFIPVYLFVIGFIIAVSINTITNGDNKVISEFGYWELIIVVILMTANAYTAWRFNDDMRFALKKLRMEVANVNESRNEIEQLIHFDKLTNLPSRINSENQYSEILESFDTDKGQISFLFLDIDNFKSINDYYNHSVGDDVLKQVADRLLGFLMEKDIACRLSGDEFLLIISRPKNYNIARYAKSILEEISKPVDINGNGIEITASLGIAQRENDKNEGFESILKRADLAMYRAKQLGKNKHSFYDEELYSDLTRKHEIVKGLKEALKNEDLELFLQPKVNINTGRIESAEALIRWVRNNPENASPAEFIPLIESTELICQVGEWVISKACILCKQLHSNGYEDLSISVNVSSAQFVMGGLENIIIHELQESKLDPKYLELELTEHILFQEDKDVLDELSRIKELGITLSIDDFGTGYSNLGYLTKFNVDTLKIDRSFITDINESSENFAIVDAIIKMAKTLGLKVVAEGVETQNEWEVLKQLGCNTGQGYIWSKPLPADEFINNLPEPVI